MKFQSEYGNEPIKSTATFENKSPNLVSAAYPAKEAPKSRELSAVKENSFVPARLKEKNQFSGLEVLQQNLNNCLRIIDDEVLKGYLTKLSELNINELDPEEVNALKDIQFFRITSLVYQEGEFSLYKLATIFNSLTNRPCTLVMMIKSDGNTNEFYLGVRSLAEDSSSGTMREMLEKSLTGMFPGSRKISYNNEELKSDLEKMDFGALSAVTCVADFRQNIEGLADNQFVQGIEKFVNSMQGKSYHAIFIADNLRYEELMQIKREYENICTQITPFVNMQMNFSTSESSGTSTGETTGSGHTENYGANSVKTTNIGTSSTNTTTSTEGKSVSDSKGNSYTSSEGNSESKGTSHGTSSSTSKTESSIIGSIGKAGKMGLAMKVLTKHPAVKALGMVTSLFATNDSTTTASSESHSESHSNTISRTLSHGINESRTIGKNQSTSTGNSEGRSYGEGTSVGESYGVSDSVNFSTSKTLSDTLGKSQGITLNARNLSLQSTVERLEKQLKRIEECESFGMWNFAAYFIGEGASDTVSAANVYRSVVSGVQSGIECSAINTWTADEDLKRLSPYIKNFIHPSFRYSAFDYDGKRYTDVSPAVLISTKELTIHMGLPYHSVKGLPVVEHAVFAQEVLSGASKEANKEIYLGNIYHLGDTTSTRVKLNLESLTMHTFITGSTGSGKSNTVYKLLSEAKKHKIPFLVVEPAKGEYRNEFPSVQCFGTNPRIGDILQLNPFAFPEGIHVLEHIDRLVEIFNVCWPMEAAMPSVLKESIEKAYIKVGWDMDASINILGDNKFPSFTDVDSALNETIKASKYSAEVKGNYIGSLSTRLKSLTNGINGRLFTKTEMDLSKLFDESAILDLSRIGSMETKAFIMGIVVLKLQEYRMSNRNGMNENLKHLTILEEAHNLLKKTSTEQSAGSANVQGKSVEMITNAIAEIRTFGEGFVIVDQAPNLLDTAAIRNTNTKIVLRLPEGSDRAVAGASMALSEKQIAELSKLPKGVAAIYQNEWQEAVLCKVDKFEKENLPIAEKPTLYESENEAIKHLLYHIAEMETEPIPKDERKLLLNWIKRLNSADTERKVLVNFVMGKALSDKNKFLALHCICDNILQNKMLQRQKNVNDVAALMNKILKRRYDLDDNDLLFSHIENICEKVLTEKTVVEGA